MSYILRRLFSEFLDSLERRPPASLIVCKDYVDLGGNNWIPATTVSYIIESARRAQMTDPSDLEKLLELKNRDPNTASLNDVVASASVVWELDLETLRVNEAIDPAIFEQDLFPEDFPVNNFVLGATERSLTQAAMEGLDNLDDGIGKQESNVEKKTSLDFTPEVLVTNGERTSKTGGRVFLIISISVVCILGVTLLLYLKGRRS